MIAHNFPDRRRSAGTLALVITLHALLLLALLRAHVDGSLPTELARRLVVFDVVVPLPREAKPPPPRRKRQAAHASKPKRPEGKHAAPAKLAQATAIKAVVPKVVLPVPAAIAATPVSGAGTEQSQGAAPMEGPGTGAGGTGNGTGSGTAGDGSGGGASGGDGQGTAPRLIAGNITRRDYPRELRDSLVPIETINLEFSIGIDGRVHECKILKSSGSDLLDQRTCRLYETRYRYEPARDASGQPEQVKVRATRTWFIVGRG